GNGAKEGFLHSMESNDLKNTITPISTVAIMPSPILLWRFKTMMVWLWGVNLWVFAQSSISYAKIFYLDQNHLTHREIWKVLSYFAVVMVLIFPFDIFHLSSGYYLLRTLWRIVFPLQVFSDLERSACRMVHRQVATIAWFEADSVCGSHSIAIPLVLVSHYCFRLFQCLRQYKETMEKAALFNALKYSTAVPVIFLSALKYHVIPDKWTNFYRPLWILSSVLNSLYSFYWDVTRDWDSSCFTRIFKFNKPSLWSYLLNGRKWVYFWVIGSNLILRCTWTYKLSALLPHNYLTVFTITALEMFRRFQWAFFRVENEWNKMSSKSNIQLSTNEISYFCRKVFIHCILIFNLCNFFIQRKKLFNIYKATIYISDHNHAQLYC
ncbi:hypothetical protein P3X46_018237, partial [Hevea brasiliensis]